MEIQSAIAAKTRSGEAGYTLMELLVVLVILGLLTALVGPRLFDQLERSKVRTAETQVHMLKSALDTMRLDLGRYPTAEEGLQLLVTAPTDPDSHALWRGPYLEGPVPLDPWNKPYLYSPEGREPKSVAIYSWGPDGKPGGEAIGLPPRL